MGWKIFAICSAFSCIWGVFDSVTGNDPIGMIDAIALLFWLCGTAIVCFYAFNVIVLDLKVLKLFLILFSVFVLAQIGYVLWSAFILLPQARSNAYALGIIIPLMAIILLDVLSWIAVRRYSRGCTLHTTKS